MRSVRVNLVSNQLNYSSELLDGAPLDQHGVRVKVNVAAVNRPNRELLSFFSTKTAHKSFPACTSFSGEIEEIGASVTRFEAGDNVCGILSPLSSSSACADLCDVHELDIVKVPSARTHTDAAACIGSAVRAYTAMIYHGQIAAGKTVLIMSAASSNGIIAIQLANHWGAKVIATVNDEDERGFLEKNFPNIEQIIDIGSKNSSLVSVVMEETGSLGVDMIIDDGVRMYSDDHPSQETCQQKSPTKHNIISCLAVNGKWITSQAGLQLDPPDSLMLFMRNASLCYLFEPVWNTSRAQQGKYLHILNDIMDKLASGAIKAHVSRTLKFSDAEIVLPELPETQIGATVMYMEGSKYGL